MALWKETTRVNATDSWRLYCEKRWSDRQVGTITRAEVQAWISDIIASAGAPSVSRPYQTMLGICRMAVRDKLILNNPCENVELPKLPRRKSRRVYLTISRLLAFADECARGKHLGAERRALVLTLGFCGLRWGEAAALKARDLDFDGECCMCAATSYMSGLDGSRALRRTARNATCPCRASSWTR